MTVTEISVIASEAEQSSPVFPASGSLRRLRLLAMTVSSHADRPKTGAELALTFLRHGFDSLSQFAAIR
jgi:hypothetical protein